MQTLIKTIKSSIALSTLAIVGLTVGLTGCATTSNISPQYVAPSTYQAYDCTALSQELERIDRYVATERSRQTTLSTSGVGVGISAGRGGIWPNISFGVGKSNASQVRDINLSKLYGERDAVIQVAHNKQCAFANQLKTYGQQ